MSYRSFVVLRINSSRYPERAYAIRPYEIPGFRVALAIASLPGMTFDLCCQTSVPLNYVSSFSDPHAVLEPRSKTKRLQLA